MNYKTTPEHFKDFTKYCSEYVGKLGLKQWDISYSHEDIEDRDIQALIKFYFTDRCAVIALAKEHTLRPTKALLRKYAVHEVMHLFFADVFEQFGEDTPELLSLEHGLIRTLEKLL